MIENIFKEKKIAFDPKSYFKIEDFTIAGPCAVESYEQCEKIAKFLKSKGIEFFRAGAYKPRTSPFDFQGLRSEGIKILKKIKSEIGIKIVTEAMDIESLKEVSDCADIIQIGSRNMQNFELLKAVGKQDKPVLLKRGFSSSFNEWIKAAEYIFASGNEKVIFCERGIRTYNDYTRNTLDLAAVPIIKNETNMPIIVDPSHATGLRELVEPMAIAAIASGADGIMLEVHYNPEESVSDARQTISFDEFEELQVKLKKLQRGL